MKKIENNQRRILKKLDELKRKIEGDKQDLSDYVSEQEAKKLLGRGTTWFWERRKAGVLPYTKHGGQVYYRRADLVKYMEDGFRKD
ncbi:MAG: helix-turn-helix domain-containing protein [Bacteroidia bacterium]